MFSTLIFAIVVIVCLANGIRVAANMFNGFEPMRDYRTFLLSYGLVGFSTLCGLLFGGVASVHWLTGLGLLDLVISFLMFLSLVLIRQFGSSDSQEELDSLLRKLKDGE